MPASSAGLLAHAAAGPPLQYVIGASRGAMAQVQRAKGEGPPTVTSKPFFTRFMAMPRPMMPMPMKPNFTILLKLAASAVTRAASLLRARTSRLQKNVQEIKDRTWFAPNQIKLFQNMMFLVIVPI